MITRGTTPYHNFILPLSSSDIDKIYVTYFQNGEILFERDNSTIELRDVDLTDNASVTDYDDDEVLEAYCQASIHLTQEETLSLKFYPAAEKNILWIQIRVLTTDGEAYASEPLRERIYGVFKNTVIGEETEEQS